MTQKISYAGPAAGFCCRWLLWLALIGGGFTARAQWLTQTNVIVPGWSAVYFYVDASGYGENIDQLVGNNPGNPIDQIWLWKYPAGNAQYLSTPDSPYSSGGQWATWLRTLANTNTPNSLEEIVPNAAYLVHSTAATNYTWKLQGQPEPPSYTWDMTGLNFIGFDTPYANPPNFQDYFAQDPAIANVVQIDEYVGGPFSAFNPQPVFTQYTTPVTRGQAYWVSTTNLNSTYFGPFTVTLPNSSGLNYGGSGGQFTLQLINTTTNTLTVSVLLQPSETPPLGQTSIVAPPPLLVEGALNNTNLTYAYTTLPVGTAESWTLAPAGQPGSDVPVVLGVNRYAMTSAAGSLYAGFLQFTDSLGFSEVDVPVSATSANNAGLWVGSASISEVGSYLITYATNANGTYANSVVTSFLTNSMPAPLLVTTNELTSSVFITNTTINYQATNLLTFNLYTQYLSQSSSNVFVLATNLAVNYLVNTNVTIQTNITGFTFNGLGQLVLTTANTTNTQITAVDLSTNQTLVSNNIPVVLGNFLRAATPVVGNAPEAVAAVALSGTANWALISANTTDSTLTVLTNQAGGGFVTSGTYAVGTGPGGVTAAHVNGTTNWDLISANTTAGTLTVLTNSGNGGFVLSGTYTAGTGACAVTAADVNGDGWVDLIVANKGAGTLTVLTNNRSGRFVLAGTYTVGTGPGAVVAAHVNGTTNWDLICANITNSTLTVLTNNGTGGFVISGTWAVGAAPYWVAAANVNGIGPVDLISANSGTNTLTILTNYVNWPVSGQPEPVATTLVTNYSITTVFTVIGIDTAPVTNVVVTSSSTTNQVAGTSPEQLVVITTLYATNNFATTNLSTQAVVVADQTNTSATVATSYYPMAGAFVVHTNVVNGSTNWISYNVLTNAVVTTNTLGTVYLTNTLTLNNVYTINLGVTNLASASSNWVVTVTNLPVTTVAVAQTNLSLLIATNLAWLTTATPLYVTNSSYQITSINTNLGAVVTPYPIRLIVFYDGNNSCSLLQRVYYGMGTGSNLVVATTQNSLNVANLNTARRITATSLPWTAANVPWAFNAPLTAGSVLTTTVTDAYDDQAANPFLHTYHPDHNNLTPITNPTVPPHELPQGSQSYGISRQITLNIQPNTANFISLTTANSSLSGTYSEVITLTGVGGFPRTFTIAGTFSLLSISAISILTTH